MLSLKKKKIWLLGVIVLIVVYLAFKLHKPGAVKAAENSSNERLLNDADVITVARQPISDAIYFTGDLMPKTQTIISSEVDAKVLQVLVDEGQMVKAKQILARLDTTDLTQAVTQQEAEVSAARAKYELDLQKMQKQEELYKQGFVSKIAYQELVTNYKASWQSYKAQEALLIRTKKQLSDTNVTAPFSGIIYQKDVERGQLVSKNTKLFSLAALNDMEIKAAIPDEYINQIKQNQQVSFRIENNSQIFHGIVSRVNQVAQSGTRSYMVYIDFTNEKYHLKAGQFIKGQIVVRELNNQLVLPCDAIRHSESGTFVLALDNNIVKELAVAIALKNRVTNKCAVTGLNPGDKVLTENVLSVKSGDKIKILQ